jgi:hypothetical protein
MRFYHETLQEIPLCFQTIVFLVMTQIAEKLDRLTVHEYVSRHQSRYLTDLKGSMSTNECIILLDFNENYSFIVQDAAQGYHWDNTQATLHPFVAYFKAGMKHGALVFVLSAIT